MNDHDEARDLVQDEYAQELDALLNLLETVDSQITPEHVAGRFHEFLDAMGDDRSSVIPPPGTELDGFAVESLLKESLGEPTAPARLMTVAVAEAQRCIEDAHRRAEELQDTALAKAARIEAEARETARRILAAAGLAAASAAVVEHLEPASAEDAASREETPTLAAELSIVLAGAA